MKQSKKIEFKKCKSYLEQKKNENYQNNVTRVVIETSKFEHTKNYRLTIKLVKNLWLKNIKI